MKTLLRLFTSALCVVSSLAFSANVDAAAADRPNVVLIFIDDLGIGDVGPFGNKTIRTPNLDRMAAEGLKFQSFYATPVCSMSRAALMSGCYNARVSMPGVLFPGSNVGLHPDETTVADLVKSAGYATICIGKWHLGHRDPFLPTRQGFDSYFGIPYSNDMTIDPKHAVFAKDCVFRNGMTIDQARSGTIKHEVPLMRGTEVVEYPADQDTLTKRYTEEAVSFMKQHRDDPFFLYLPHNMVHVPLAASDAFRGKSEAGLFGDAVEEVDWSVGEILRTLKELKLDEKTLVIFTSDNGAASGSALPFRGKKGTSYEGGVREPCIMRWPGKIPAGSVCKQIAGNVDVLPTVAALIGKPVVDNKVNGRTIDGRDLSPLLANPQGPPARTSHLYFSGTTLLALRVGDWKLFPTAPAPKSGAKPAPKAKVPASQRPKGKKAAAPAAAEPARGPELYNLADDPNETKNLAAEMPEKVAELKAEFERRAAEIKAEARPVGTIDDGAEK